MEQFCANFREAWFTDTGGVRTQRGHKILYEAEVPQEHIKEGYVLPVWVVATVKETDGDQVWLDDVEVLNGFLDTERNELVVKHAKDIANNFQGDKALKLTRTENWFMFPQGTEVEVKNYINNYGQEALKSALGLYQEILPFPKLLALMKLPPNVRVSHLPFFIYHQWVTYPKELLKGLKAMSPAATLDEIYDHLDQSIDQDPLHAFMHSPSPSHQILPIPQLLQLLKLPPNFKPSHIPSFIVGERESCPEEFLSRLMKISKEEDVLNVLLRENIIKENSQLKGERLESVKHDVENQPEPTKVDEESEGVGTKTNETDNETEETRSGEIPQTEIIEKDKEEKDTGELEGVDTPSAPLTELQFDVVESVTIHEDVPSDKDVDKVKEVFEKNTENVIDEEPEKEIITDLKQEQVDTNFAASTESHDEIVAEEEVQEMNKVTETTTMESIETDSDKVCTTGTVHEVKEPEMIEKESSTQKSASEPKEEEENGESEGLKCTKCERIFQSFLDLEWHDETEHVTSEDPKPDEVNNAEDIRKNMEEQENLEKESSTQKSASGPKEEEENGETIRANVDVKSGPSPLTFESDEYLVTGEVIATFSDSKVPNEEPNTLRTGGKSSIAQKEVSEEAAPSGNHEQVEELRSKPEKLITNESTESHINDKQNDKMLKYLKGQRKRHKTIRNKK